MKIIITTFMREDNQKALAQIPEKFHSVTHVFTREDRVSELKKHVPSGVNVHANPMDIDGIADIRQRCIDAVALGKVWFIDDLCVFGKRIDNDPTKLVSTLTPEDFEALYNRVSTLLDSYCQVGISPRMGNNRIPEAEKEIGRSYTTYGLRTDWMKSNSIRFDGMYRLNKEAKLYEDYYITLKMLTAGLKNTVIYDYFFNYTHNKAGGNSTFRNLNLQEKSARELKKHFYQFVEVVYKEDDWNGNGMSGRAEPRIAWKKAYESSFGASDEDMFA